MKTKIFNLVLAGLFISGVVLTGCSKSETMQDLNNNSQQIAAKAAGDEPAEAGILNKELKITYANDNGTDITQQFHFYTFKFVGNYPGGEAQVWNDLLAQTGSWTGAPGTITLAYPTNIFTEMVFMNRTWTVTEGTPGIFNLTAPDGDQVRLSTK